MIGPEIEPDWPKPTPGSPADIRYQERRHREAATAKGWLVAIRAKLRGEPIPDPPAPINVEPGPQPDDGYLEEAF